MKKLLRGEKMSHYFLQILNPDDNFCRSTEGNDLDLSDLKEIAQDRIAEKITWDSTFSHDEIVGYIFSSSFEKKEEFAVIRFQKTGRIG
jgi:hypothetical protein